MTDKNFDTVGLGLGYSLGALNFGLGYAYTWAEKGNGLEGSDDKGSDLKDNHVAAATVNYNLAPGLNTYAEVIYEIQNFRLTNGNNSETSWEQATFLTGVSVAF